MDFDIYKKLGEPLKKEKSEIWQTAIGLQEVDGLKPSEYLIKTAKENIEGDITFEDVKNRLNTYYTTHQAKSLTEDRTEEADKVSARIAEVLSEKTFVFSPAQYIGVHKRIFEGFKFSGKIRDYNISKNEWVLDGDTVHYSGADLIRDTLDYDFATEKKFNYSGLSKLELVEHFANFISDIWQIYPFGEGNTRAVAVFAIKYLRSLGINADNDMFAKNSWFFRNALVRANYNNAEKNVYATNKFLINFFENLILNKTNMLKNREMHIFYDDTVNSENDTVNSENDTVNQQIIQAIMQNSSVNTIELSKMLSVSESTIKRRIKMLKESGVLIRDGSDKKGIWVVK